MELEEGPAKMGTLASYANKVDDAIFRSGSRKTSDEGPTITMKGEHPHHDYLKRLPPESYCGQAYVHWSMTIAGRKQGWLVPSLHYKFREILTHTMFRFGLTCPILLYAGSLPYALDWCARQV